MEDYKIMYERLLEEFQNYQNFAEKQLQMMNEKNIRLEKNLDSLSNIVEINKYINSYISHEDIISMINDMIVGILGVTYSTICLKEGSELVVKATNTGSNELNFVPIELDFMEEEKEFLINIKDNIYPGNSIKRDIHSIIGVPVKIRSKFIGYVIVEHSHYNFFTQEHIKFITTIANQIAIAIENNQLYIRINEAAKRDPFMDIYHRKYFYELVERQINEKPECSFGIVMVDLDRFKVINDTFGHQFGDEALLSTVRILEKNLKEKELVARYGGEELVLYLGENESKEAIYERVEHMRKELEEHLVCFDGKCERVTASFGLSFYPDDGQDSDQITKVADILLYEAKENGRNRVVSSHNHNKNIGA